MACLLSYWRLTVPAKSETEIEAEQWLLVVAQRYGRFFTLPWIRFDRWHLVVAATLNLMCVGSIFSTDFLENAIDGFFLDMPTHSVLSCQLVGMITMGLSAALCGPFVESRGPRMSMAIATGLVVLGWICAQLSIMFSVYSLLNIGIGILVSFGYGITILVSVSTVQKWFPDLRGIVTGICIAGIGGGTLLWLRLYAILFHRKSEKIFVSVSRELDNDGLNHVFLLHGGVALVVMLFATITLRTPPPNYAVNGVDVHCVPLNKAPTAAHVQNNYLDAGMTLVNYDAVGQNQPSTTDGIYFAHVKALSLGQCIFSSDFFFLYVAFAASISPRVLLTFEMTEFMVELAGSSTEQANILLLYVNVAGTLGNFTGAFLADVIIRLFYANPAYVRKMVFTALLLSQVIGLNFLINNVEDPESLKWPLYVVSFTSGGSFGLVPSFLADLFGLYNAGTMYGLILTTCSIGSLLMGIEHRQEEHHSSDHFQILFILSIVGCVVMVLVRSSSMDRFYRGYQLTICDKIIIQRPSQRLIMEQNKAKSSDFAGTDLMQECVGGLQPPGNNRLSDSTSPIPLVDPDYLHFSKCNNKLV
ncbi:unnamed protein product [Aphanomyces euteiches]